MDKSPLYGNQREVMAVPDAPSIAINYLKIRVFAFTLMKVEKWWDFKNHLSPFARIFLIRDGQQRVSFGDEAYHHRFNSLALVPPYTPVDYYCDDFCQQYYFIFSCQLPNGKDLFADYKFPYHLSAEPWHHSLCDQLITILPDFGLNNTDADSKDFNELIYKSKFEAATLSQKLAAQGALSLLLSTFAAGAEENHQTIRFVRTLQFIENNLASDLSLRTLSEIEGISPTYFSDQFRLHTGVRPSEYIAQKRENRAKELLSTTQLSLPEIAEKVGFADTSYFFRFFKKRIGLTPRAYRMR